MLAVLDGRTANVHVRVRERADVHVVDVLPRTEGSVVWLEVAAVLGRERLALGDATIRAGYELVADRPVAIPVLVGDRPSSDQSDSHVFSLSLRPAPLATADVAPVVHPVEVHLLGGAVGGCKRLLQGG